MPGAIEANIRTLREHYDSLFNLVDRSGLYEAGGFTDRPPIVNMGYWRRGAKTARQAQEQFVHELASRAGSVQEKRVLDAAWAGRLRCWAVITARSSTASTSSSSRSGGLPASPKGTR